MSLDLRELLINRQTALKCATELVCSGYVSVGEANPADVIETLADQFEERLLNPDNINHTIRRLASVIDPPLPEPTPITPAAAEASPPPASAATPAPTPEPTPISSAPSSAPAPAAAPAKVGPQDGQVAKYAGTKCPYHPQQSRPSVKGAGDFCTGKGGTCEWGHYFFVEEDGSTSEKWRLRKNDRYYTAPEFDAAVAEPPG